MGKIHINVISGHLARYPEERQVIQRFTDLFDVTWADHQRFENSKASTYFLKPLPHTTQMYGFAKEVLLFYSPYETLEARTLKHAEAVLERAPARGRVERVCFILVAPIADLPQEIARVQDHGAQSATPIPFNDQELLANRDPWLLRTRFSSALFRRDLFDIEQALVTDTYFFGRMALVFDLRDRFRRGENTGLYGLRKTGKTSVIFKLARLVSAEQDEQLVYFDAQDPQVYSLRWWELLNRMKGKLALQAGLTLPAPLDRDFTERTAIKRFRESLAHILTVSHKKSARVLFVFDEIEHLCPDLSPVEHWNQDFVPFWKLLRAVQTEDRRVAFLVVGVNASASERTSVEGQDNPLFSLIGSRYIPPFEAQDTAQMVQTLGRFMGLEFDTTSCEYLQARYGGHPLLIRLACSWEHQARVTGAGVRPIAITRADLQSSETARDGDRVQYVKHIVEVLRRWYPEEFQLLSLLAVGDVATFREYAVTIPESVQHLRGYNLLSKAGDAISIGVVGDYLRATQQPRRQMDIAIEGGRSNSPIRNSSHWLSLLGDIGELRNQLEPSMRRFVKRTLVAQLGTERWIDAVLRALPQPRRDGLQGIDRDEILNDRLFLLDLLQIVEANWDRFKHLEAAPPDRRVSKASITVLVQFLNANRQDAHAKEASQADVAAVALACAGLDAILTEYLRD